MRLVLSSLLAPLLLACGSAPPNTAQRLTPSQVTEAAALPTGYETGAHVTATCSRVSVVSGTADASLDDVDCSFTRLTRILKARAGEQAASLLVGKRCRATGRGRHLSCSGTWALPGRSVSLSAKPSVLEASPAPSAEQVLDLDEPRPQDGAEIRVAFKPSAAVRAGKLAPRAYDRVDETAIPSVGRPTLGQVTASCEGCDGSALRYALRVTAGRAGAGEISSVRCFEEGALSMCAATALVPWSS
jgi:hypothetical protein